MSLLRFKLWEALPVWVQQIISNWFNLWYKPWIIIWNELRIFHFHSFNFTRLNFLLMIDGWRVRKKNYITTLYPGFENAYYSVRRANLLLIVYNVKGSYSHNFCKASWGVGKRWIGSETENILALLALIKKIRMLYWPRLRSYRNILRYMRGMFLSGGKVEVYVSSLCELQILNLVTKQTSTFTTIQRSE